MTEPYGVAEITIAAPDSAKAGQQVSVTFTIKNVGDEWISATPGFATVDGIDLPFYLSDLRGLSPGQSASWTRSFTMPNKDIAIHAESWWENTYVLHKDGTAAPKAVTLIVEQEFANFAISDYSIV